MRKLLLMLLATYLLGTASAMASLDMVLSYNLRQHETQLLSMGSTTELLLRMLRLVTGGMAALSLQVSYQEGTCIADVGRHNTRLYADFYLLSSPLF